MLTNYPFKATEQKWQQIWQNNNYFATDLTQTNRKQNYYVLEMLPYPSGKVHMGHVRNYTIGDALARYKRAKGFNVLYPMGWDAFGLPAENAAKEHGVHPKLWTTQNIQQMKAQLLLLGFSWDWSREVATNSPHYTKVEQEIFIDLYKHGLAYRKEGWVNWDPVEATVLANEQVVDGKGWRSGALVEQKKLNQWFLKITSFADDLLDSLKSLTGWSDQLKNIQQSWIGKSNGANINFKLSNGQVLSVYSTKPYTLFGASFIAISVRNDLSVTLSEHNAPIKDFIDKYKNIKNFEEELKDTEKDGIKTTLTAINPVNGEILPVYIANYVLDYGNGAIFGCPAHDVRDFEFAKKYSLPLKQVIKSVNSTATQTLPYDEEQAEDVIIHSSFLDGLSTHDAFLSITQYLEKNNLGEKISQFKLKDWGVSRQRYWGTPIPIIYCKTCGAVPEKPENLPILLPDDVDFSSQQNPLENHPTFKHTKCSICNEDALRDTDTLDTFVESSWYYISYIAQGTEYKTFDKTLLASFLPVDSYIGGIEHAIMHLLYSRFMFKALIKMGYIDSKLNEPFLSLLTQGMITHKTYKTKNSGKWAFPSDIIEKEGVLIDNASGEEVVEGAPVKMSKSKKNVVDPVLMCATYGADTARLFVLSDSPPEKGLEWAEDGLEATYKFINRIWRSVNLVVDKLSANVLPDNLKVENLKVENLKVENLKVENLNPQDLQFYIKIQQYIYNIEEYTKSLHFNKTIALCRELFNLIEDYKQIENMQLLRYSVEVFLQLANPIIPHITEELWQVLGKQTPLAKSPYPIYNTSYLQLQTITVAIQINGKTKGSINVPYNISQDDLIKEIMQIASINKLISDKTFKKVIYVPKKIINIVL